MPLVYRPAREQDLERAQELALLWQIYSRCFSLQIHFLQRGHRCGGGRAMSSRMAWRTAGNGRTRVVGAFPDGQSCLNLAAARLRYIAGTAWSAKCYMNMRPLYQQLAQTGAAVA